MFAGTLNEYLERFGMDQKLCFSDLWCLADSNDMIEKKHAWDKHLSKGGAAEEDDWCSALILSHTTHTTRLPSTATRFDLAIGKHHWSTVRSPWTSTTTRSEARCRSKLVPTHNSLSLSSATAAFGMKVTRGLCPAWSTFFARRRAIRTSSVE